MAIGGTETRRGGLLPGLRTRREERRGAVVPAPRDGRERPAPPDREHGGEREAAAAPDFHARWESALGELELEVEAAEDLLGRLHGQQELPAANRRPWAVPSGLGPLPAPLGERARALADRQARAAEALARAMVLNRRQARAVDALVEARSRKPADAQALYLDVAL